ncbi:MAG: acyltransferase family protein, partial [Alphaproteobacteria bacterium]
MGVFLMPTRAWQFGLGALAYLLPQGSLARLRMDGVAGWAGAGAILFASVTLNENEPGFPGALAASPSIGAMLILISGESTPRYGIGRLLSAVPMQYVGRRSYSWYLWHWPFLVFAGVLMPQAGPSQLVLVVLASFGTAAVTHELVENPIRFSAYLAPRSVVSLALAVLLTIGAATIAYKTYAWSKLALDSPAHRRFADAAEVPLKYHQCFLRSEETEVKECVFGRSDASDTAVLFGDSHAAQWLPALDALGSKYGFRVVTLNKTSCPSVTATVFSVILKREYHECQIWRQAALKRIEELHPKLVISSSSIGYVMRHDATSVAITSLQQWRDGTRQTYGRFDSAGIPVLVIRDTPSPGKNVVECLVRADWH